MKAKCSNTNCRRTIEVNDLAETVRCPHCGWRQHPEQMESMMKRQHEEDPNLSVTCTWTSSHIIPVPDGMTHEEAAEAFNNGDFDKFDDFNNGGADLTNWHAL